MAKEKKLDHTKKKDLNLHRSERDKLDLSKKEQMYPINILLVDRIESFRKSFENKLTQDASFHLVAQAGCSQEVFNIPTALTADVALVDVDLPEGCGFEVARRLLHRRSQMKVILLVYQDWDSYLVVANALGISGVLFRTSPQIEVIEQMRRVEREKLFTVEQQNRIKAWKEKYGAGLKRLSKREWGVLCLAARGMNNTEISDRMEIQENTVEKHICNILLKMEIKNRSKLVYFFFEQHLDVLACMEPEHIPLISH